MGDILGEQVCQGGRVLESSFTPELNLDYMFLHIYCKTSSVLFFFLGLFSLCVIQILQKVLEGTGEEALR